MPTLASLTTVSGILGFVATLMLMMGRRAAAAVLFISAGSGGIGIFWDRWSRDSGEHARLTALFSGSAPTPDQFVLLATHVPLLVVGLIALALVVRDGQGGKGVPP